MSGIENRVIAARRSLEHYLSSNDFTKNIPLDDYGHTVAAAQLIADLCHYCISKGFTPANLFNDARQVYLEDLVSEE